MELNKEDIEDVRLSRPVAVLDLWDIDDRISHLEEIIERLEEVVEVLVVLYHEERVKNWELILKEMLDRKGIKKEGKTFIRPVFKIKNTSQSEEG
jgi:hypothetical protein